jgi:hypothetical protein
MAVARPLLGLLRVVPAMPTDYKLSDFTESVKVFRLESGS